MTVLELVCALGHVQLLEHFFKKLYVRHDRDFCLRKHQKSVDQQKFIFVPLLKRDEQTLNALLELTNLWTLQDLKDIMLLCKQLKWSEGLEITLRSKSCHRQFLTIPHTEQNQFLHYVTQIPYQQIDDVDAECETTSLEQDARKDIQVTVNGKKVVEQQELNPQEQRQHATTKTG